MGRFDVLREIERLAPAAALVAPLAHLGDQDRGVVVAALGRAVELAAAMEQAGDARYAVGAVERDLQRPNRVPGKLVAERQVHDPLMIAHGIELFDLPEDVESSH